MPSNASLPLVGQQAVDALLSGNAIDDRLASDSTVLEMTEITLQTLTVARLRGHDE